MHSRVYNTPQLILSHTLCTYHSLSRLGSFSYVIHSAEPLADSALGTDHISLMSIREITENQSGDSHPGVKGVTSSQLGLTGQNPGCHQEEQDSV
ncbi:hypothetical protein I79_015896 [Cricetulus griseus]|uniref:Uncharacterized protein n=1 Tax=Cricetulus griseus TaxID=10029 RepID=G3HXY0_CRIGR|nr:hypothetical protein I79_015896 [Cricetulus griseus]